VAVNVTSPLGHLQHMNLGSAAEFQRQHIPSEVSATPPTSIRCKHWRAEVTLTFSKSQKLDCGLFGL
jgi:hypothetical protein